MIHVDQREPSMSLMQKLSSLVRTSVWKCLDPAPYHLNVDGCTQRNIFRHFDESSLKYSPVNKADSEDLPRE